MVASVRTTCPRCGTIELPVAEGMLTIPTRAGETRARFEFSCPSCDGVWEKELTERSTLLLMDAGISVGEAVEQQLAPAPPDDLR